MQIVYKEVASIPWHRLTTAYGRGTEIPELIKHEQYGQLAQLIEHQSTLWQVTPWTIQQLLYTLPNRPIESITQEEIQLYEIVASAFTWEELTSNPVQHMDELLQEKWLWSEIEDDELGWEEEEPRGYEQCAFVSYYVYSEYQMYEAIPIFQRIASRREHLAPSLLELIALLESRKKFWRSL
ncbi:hypothetical protein [Metasolibacillus sp.]|uniref:hypothetical protein n=1 Tax=Metasolibacillus sp. TaxID=2703680 RepID=UPI0025EE69DC|nr:hypothetical protein [Metasolibacillus sp.]MCT6925783.1 hypothetical protein [Metasolibacillus sp.]MCT6941891.1 hypothetical protein [Metasolibacillus sp.]